MYLKTEFRKEGVKRVVYLCNSFSFSLTISEIAAASSDMPSFAGEGKAGNWGMCRDADIGILRINWRFRSKGISADPHASSKLSSYPQPPDKHMDPPDKA